MTEEKKSEKQKQVRNRSIRTDNLLRETSSHYIRQIGDADRKARILLVVTSIMITIGVTVITKNIIVIAQGWIAAIFLIVGNLVTLFFSILSIKPRLKGEIAEQTEDNILHYKTCTENSLELYTQKMFETLDDDKKKRDAIIKELYYYGNLLDEKYKCIERAHRAFFWGFVLTIVVYAIIYAIDKFLR